VVFGGNTSCLEIRADERLVIVDFGTGVRPLSDHLMANDFKRGPIDADIFITHTHWDHIMGFPLFVPLFIPTSTLRIRGPVSSEDEGLESLLSTQLSYKFWPVRLSELNAQIKYDQLKETTLDLGGGLTVSSKYLNHPILCLGYRFEYQGKSVVTLYDHEPFQNLFPTDPNDPAYDEAAAQEGELAAKEENEKITAFYKGADVLVHDCQYTEKEYRAGHHNWGHSFYEQVIPAARNAGVKKLILTHHDPNRTDEQLAAFESGYQEPVKSGLLYKAQRLCSGTMKIKIAKEGMTVEA
jgi:ribonuclease BN (tRNA processing enzyme)